MSADYDGLTYSNSNYCQNGTGNQYNNNNNFHSADYITLPKSKSGNGHSTSLFWTLVVLLFVLAVGNLILTFTILGVLRLGQGMESLELVPEDSLIKFFGNVDLDRVFKRDGKLESFNDSPMEIMSQFDATHISIIDEEKFGSLSPSLELGPKRGYIKNVESFEVKHPVTGESIFSTDFPNFGLPRGVVKLDVNEAVTKRIASPVDQSLIIKSDSKTKLKGNEGTHMEGREIIWSADEEIFLKSVNRSIILSGYDGVFINIKRIPVATSSKESGNDAQYKICVCMPAGKLFRVLVPQGQSSQIGCNSVDLSLNHNPCM